MVRTRVGYAGGEKESPTYHSLGNHSETIEVDYDPDRISYQELLDVFWASHSPTMPAWSRQYASIIFYHDQEQMRLAEESKERQQANQGRTMYTSIAPHTRFYRAEDYHQKYRLRFQRELMAEFDAMYPNYDDFVDSTAAARLNGLVAGYGTAELLAAELDSYGLSPEGKARLLEVTASLPSGAYCPTPN